MGISAERAKYSGVTICSRVLYCGMTTTQLMSELGKVSEILGTKEIRVDNGPQKYPKLTSYEVTLCGIKIADVHVLQSNKDSGGTIEVLEFYVVNWARAVHLTGANNRPIDKNIAKNVSKPFENVYYGGILLPNYMMRDVTESKTYEQVTYRYTATLYACSATGEVSAVRISRAKRR